MSGRPVVRTVEEFQPYSGESPGTHHLRWVRLPGPCPLPPRKSWWRSILNVLGECLADL